MSSKTVFLSYRRTDFAWAMAVYQDLARHGFDVFLDYEQISSGRFEQVILESIRARTHFLLLLTQDALDRCDQPEDWLRREIEEALRTQRNIVPLFIHGFRFDTPKITACLTGELEKLRSYNGVTISPEYFVASMEKIRRFLSRPLEPIRTAQLSRTAQVVAERQRLLADTARPIDRRELQRPAQDSSAAFRAGIVLAIVAAVAVISYSLY